MTNSNKVQKQLERKTIYSGGIGVNVEINYVLGTISLIENTGGPKKWIFANRELGYMTGWQNILDAIKYAIEVCEKDLEKHQKAQEKELKEKKDSLERAIIEEVRKR